MFSLEEARRLSEEARLRLEAEQRKKEEWERSDEFHRLKAEEKKRKDELFLKGIADRIEREVEAAVQLGKKEAVISYTGPTESSEMARRLIVAGEVDKILQPYQKAGYRADTSLKRIKWWYNCYITVSWMEEQPDGSECEPLHENGFAGWIRAFFRSKK